MKILSLLLVSFLFVGSLSFAEVASQEPVAVSNGLPVWLTHLNQTISNLKSQNKYTETGYTECVEAKEVPNAFLCMMSERKIMNLALLRASVYSEGDSNAPAGTVIPFSYINFPMLMQGVLGHDIPSNNLQNFITAVTEACAKSNNDPNICPNQYEKELFETYLIPKLQEKIPFVVIAASSDQGKQLIPSTSHEILHAQYFLNDIYRNTIDDFWNKTLTASDRQEAKDSLAFGYDVTNEYVMRNEFQAYILEVGGDHDNLADLATKYASNLRAALIKAGAPAVQVQSSRNLPPIHAHTSQF